MLFRSGLAALRDYRQKSGDIAALSQLLSAKPAETPEATARVLAALSEARQQAGACRRALMDYKIQSLRPTPGHLCLFEDTDDTDALRELANAGAALCSGICAVFTGDDESGYRFLLASQSINLLTEAPALYKALEARGGGSAAMLQGRAAAPRARLEAYFSQE